MNSDKWIINTAFKLQIHLCICILMQNVTPCGTLSFYNEGPWESSCVSTAVGLITGDSNSIGSVMKHVIQLECLISHSWTNWGHLTKKHSPLVYLGFQGATTKKQIYVKDIMKYKQAILDCDVTGGRVGCYVKIQMHFQDGRRQ